MKQVAFIASLFGVAVYDEQEREISRLQQCSQIVCNTTVASTPDSSTLVT